MKLGVIADTHGFFDPGLNRMFAGVDAILHAGDVGSAEVLNELAAIAPVYAVRGNVDNPELDLPPSSRLSFHSLTVEMLHILPAPPSELEAWARTALAGGRLPALDRLMAAFHGSTNVVVFGHTHRPCLVNLRRRLFFNPGSAGPQRFSLPRSCGRLEIAPGGIEATILRLAGYNGVVLNQLRLEVNIEVNEGHVDPQEHQTRLEDRRHRHCPGDRRDRKV